MTAAARNPDRAALDSITKTAPGPASWPRGFLLGNCLRRAVTPSNGFQDRNRLRIPKYVTASDNCMSLLEQIHWCPATCALLFEQSE